MYHVYLYLYKDFFLGFLDLEENFPLKEQLGYNEVWEDLSTAQ